MKGKRGSSHFEMIMAFLFFIGFMLFLFTFMKPYDEGALPSAAIESVFDSFYEEAKTNYTKIFFKANSTIIGPPEDCFFMNLEQNNYMFSLENSIVKDAVTLSQLDSQISSGGVLYISDDEGYYYASFSPEFIASTATCPDPNDNLQIGSILEKEILSLKKIDLIDRDYVPYYEDLKIRLGVPPIYDFSINAPRINLEMEQTIPDTGDVLAKDFIVEVLNESNGNIINTRFTVKIW